ncbi:MAG: DUF6259 domain-containing protein [Candidatus Latescibacterota bacterium]
MEQIVLKNSTTQAVFDRKTGALISLSSEKSGWKIHERKELGLSFRMVVPILERRNNQILGEKQPVADLHLDRENERLTLQWSHLLSEHGGVLDISFTGIITLGEDGLVFEAKVTNNSPYTIESISWPCVGEIAPPFVTARLGRRDFGALSMQPLYPKFQSERGYFGIDYPIQMAATPRTPFVLIDGETQGLYAGYHDTTAAHLVQFTFELIPGFEYAEDHNFGTVPKGKTLAGQPARIAFYATHLPFVNAGESAVLLPLVLQPYVGSWHKGADTYRRWRKGAFPSPRTPEWADQVHSWQQIHINSPEDELRCPYKELVKYGEDCRKHGVAAIQLTGWTVGGQDRGNPSHDVDLRLGSTEDLREAIAAIHRMGVKVILFTKFTWADRSEEFFRTKLKQYAVKDPYGDYHVFSGYQYQTPTQLSDINTRRLIPMCMNAPEWRKLADIEFTKVVDLGAAGMLYDECQHHGGALFCFDPDHGHHVPAHVFSGDADLAGGFHAIAQTRNPDFLFAGEALYDIESQFYPVSYTRIGLNHVSIHRYINPDAGMMIAVTGYNDRIRINQALMFRYILSYEPRNFKGRLDEFPETMKYGKQMDALRTRYSAYLWDAQFEDTMGAHVASDGKPFGTYTVFIGHATGKKAVAVSNFDYEKHVAVTVTLDPPTSDFSVVTPEHPDPLASAGTGTIPPLSTMIFLEN